MLHPVPVWGPPLVSGALGAPRQVSRRFACAASVACDGAGSWPFVWVCMSSSQRRVLSTPLSRNVESAPQVVFPGFPVTRDLTGGVPDWDPTLGVLGELRAKTIAENKKLKQENAVLKNESIGASRGTQSDDLFLSPSCVVKHSPRAPCAAELYSFL